MKKTIIGLVGVKQSGKSTAANLVLGLFPFAAEAALADKLKDVCSSVFCVKRSHFDSQELKEVPFKEGMLLTEKNISDVLSLFNIKGVNVKERFSKIIGMKLKTPRHIAQIVGTEVLRTAGKPSVHCDNINLTASNVMVVTDIRFKNEHEYFSNKDKFDFIPIYMSRKKAEDKVTEDSHQSEREVFDIKEKCIVINNNGSLESTEDQLKCVLSMFSNALQK